MMVRIDCPRCGERVAVAPDEVELSKRPDGCNEVRFTYPVCGRGAAGCLDADGAALLRSDGVAGIEVPLEALEEHEGPPFTLDDLIDMHLLLGSEGWQQRIAESVAQSWLRRFAGVPGRHGTRGSERER